jgi:LysR family transcriptional regulator, benzoate and cis,cis-muconate-responsive activator of ben and cat genes
MELRHLRYFVAVGEEKNVTRAAARLGISQPPLSRQIRDLERELGVNLLDRSTNGVRLTEAGEMFLGEARGVLRRAEEAVERLSDLALGKRGRVRIGHGPIAVEILGRALRSFSRTHPQVSVDLQEVGMGVFGGLRDGTLDLALTAAASPREFDGLALEQLGAYPIHLAMSRKHRFARLREVALRDVAREPIVLRSRKECPYEHAGVLEILEPYTCSPKFVGEYDSLESLIAAVEAGRGVAFFIQVISRIAGERLVLRPLNPAPPVLPVAVAYRPDRLSAAAAAFLAAAIAARPKRFRSPGRTLTR